MVARVCWMLVASVAIFAPSARAQGPSTQLAGQVELARLVDVASQWLHLNID